MSISEADQEELVLEMRARFTPTFLEYVQISDFGTPEEKALAKAVADVVFSLGGNICSDGVTSRLATEALQRAIQEHVQAEVARFVDTVRDVLAGVG